MEVLIPKTFGDARQYIIDVILGDFLGLNYHIISSNQSGRVNIYCDGKTLSIADIFFNRVDNFWLKKQSLPKLPLSQWSYSDLLSSANTSNKKVPIIYGKTGQNEDYWSKSLNNLQLELDVFGSAFFMLTRYEELVINEKDGHGRFPAKASLAFKANFLHRPIINEYVEILWECIKHLWPNIERKKRQFKLMPTHDVDRPFFYYYKSKKQILRNCLADVLKRRNIKSALSRYAKWSDVKNGYYSKDPFYTFNYIAGMSEKIGIQSAFYFLTEKNKHQLDGQYNISDSVISELMQELYFRGHEIGIHGSYNSFNSEEMLIKEKELFLREFERKNIEQKCLGGRQHYLRWDSSITPKILHNAGLDYDTSLSYADHAGFRSGVCYEYPLYDLIENKKLDVVEKPLIFMECSVLDSGYMNFGSTEEALSYMLSLYVACKKYNGNFVFLWHNSHFLLPRDFEMYEAILKYR